MRRKGSNVSVRKMGVIASMGFNVGQLAHVWEVSWHFLPHEVLRQLTLQLARQEAPNGAGAKRSPQRLALVDVAKVATPSAVEVPETDVATPRPTPRDTLSWIPHADCTEVWLACLLLVRHTPEEEGQRSEFRHSDAAVCSVVAATAGPSMVVTTPRVLPNFFLEEQPTDKARVNCTKGQDRQPLTFFKVDNVSIISAGLGEKAAKNGRVICKGEEGSSLFVLLPCGMWRLRQWTTTSRGKVSGAARQFLMEL